MASVNHLVDVVVSMTNSYLSFCETSGTVFRLATARNSRKLFFNSLSLGVNCFRHLSKSILLSVCCNWDHFRATTSFNDLHAAFQQPD